MNRYKTTRDLSLEVQDHWMNSRITREGFKLPSQPISTPDIAPKYTMIAPEVNIVNSDIEVDVVQTTQKEQSVVQPLDVEKKPSASCNVDIKSLELSKATEVQLNWTPLDNRGERHLLGDPDVWGPAFWFSLHNGANHYPLEASPCVIDRTVGFIKGLPMMLPCIECKEHANRFIAEHESSLHAVCKTRDSLFKFYVDFHNSVNERKRKPTMSVAAAKQLYNGYTLSSLKYS